MRRVKFTSKAELYLDNIDSGLGKVAGVHEQLWVFALQQHGEHGVACAASNLHDVLLPGLFLRFVPSEQSPC